MFSLFLVTVAAACLAAGLEIELWRAFLVAVGIGTAAYSSRLDDIYEMLKQKEEEN